MRNKFILEGDEINPNNELDEQEVNEKGETEIKWKDLTDKNSDKLCAPKQTFPWSEYDARDKEMFERCIGNSGLSKRRIIKNNQKQIQSLLLCMNNSK